LLNSGNLKPTKRGFSSNNSYKDWGSFPNTF